MYELAFFLLFFIYYYKFCFRSMWFMVKFPLALLRYIPFVIVEGFLDLRAWIRGETRFTDYGYYVYGGDYGAGKSLNMVKHAKGLINYYSRWYKVTVISNMTIRGVDYLPFMYFEDLEYEPEEGEVVIYLIDEGGSIFYSRNYSKSRLNEDDLVLALNQVRKDNKCILISAQRHKQLDAALRRVCNYWYEVNKRWRFSFIETYEGYELEYGAPGDIAPVGYRIEYARNIDRKAYKHKEKIVMLDKERLSFTDTTPNVNISLYQRKKAKKRKVI